MIQDEHGTIVQSDASWKKDNQLRSEIELLKIFIM